VAPKQILHYKIERKIGQGGMGEVFLATDTKLNRQVALKFVPESLSSDLEARERLLREARAASQLIHPNIVTIHSIEKEGERAFIVMEYVPGKTLDEYFKGREHSTDEILSIASQLAEALQKAHDTGVVHRDLKPGNVLMDEDGRPRILDFGLAKIEGAAKLTQTGSTVGTMAYISPEQAQGKEVDPRSDIFSFGVLLYEMFAGRTPFTGEHEAALIYSIVNEEPEPLARYKSGVSDDIQRLINKCLSKNPAERYQSASDLLADLKRERRLSQSGPSIAAAAPPNKGRKTAALVGTLGIIALVVAVAFIVVPKWFGGGGSEGQAGPVKIAVLPFENIGAPEDEYFADGMTEELIARLASVKDLGVIARTSIMQYKGTEKSITEIGEELGVDYVVEGTIRWQKSKDGPDRVKITPQLVKTADGTHAWAKIYEEPMNEVFQVQSDVAAKIVAALNITLHESDREKLDAKPTDNLQAYDFYLRGNDYFQYIRGGTDQQALELAAQLYRQAIENDSTFAAAHARLGRCHIELYWHCTNDPADLGLAKEHLHIALALGPQDPDVRTATGSLYYHEQDYEKALTELTIARDLRPNNSDVLAEIGYVLRRNGEFRKGLDQLLEAIKADPRNPNYYSQTVASAIHLREYDLAEELALKSISLAPERGASHADLARIYVLRDGDPQKAADYLAGHDASTSKDWNYYNAWGRAELLLGNYDNALAQFAKATDDPQLAKWPLDQAEVELIRGNRGAANTLFDSAITLIEAKRGAWVYPHQAMSDMGVALAALGKKEQSLGLAAAAMDSVSSAMNIWSVKRNLAITHALLGDQDKALDVLEASLAEPGFLTVQTLRLSPLWKVLLQDNPRYQALIARASAS
jgi:TolB-like protein/Tfp pilus assembly protein PilF/predicted Ser/Thr protein kinase